MDVVKKLQAMCLMMVMVLGIASSFTIHASDHDDGQADLKGSALNLTDLYVFREDWQTGMSEDKDHLILIMNTSPRSLPEQQYYFSPQARYKFHLTRVQAENVNERPTGKEDIVMSLDFGGIDAQTQSFTVTVKKNGKSLSASKTTEGHKLLTTSLPQIAAGNLIFNRFNLGGHEITIFAGMREDPFFFDVTQFFKVRAGAAGLGPKVGFNPASTAEDFTEDYNVNSVVVRVPIKFLQTSAEEPIFDVWQTIAVK